MQESFVLFDQELFVTTSIGIAMYKAKEMGRSNYQFFCNDMGWKTRASSACSMNCIAMRYKGI